MKVIKASPISTAYGTDVHDLTLRTVKRSGLTVSELIRKLSYFKGDMKVVFADEKGKVWPVIQAVQDSKNTVMIF